MKKTLLPGMCLFFLAFHFSENAVAAVDSSLKPDEGEEISNVFRDMGVVQRRAMAKGGKFLLSSYGSFDFSDGPYTNYSLNLNPGYAINDFLEIYLNVAVKFFVSPRSVVGLVSQFQLSDGTQAFLTSPEPTSQFGVELLWAPAYGKDSLGMQHVIRSDTFFKAGAAQVSYVGGKSGLRFVGGVGKTFFLSKVTGFRICVDWSYNQTTVNEVKSFRSMTLVESGLVFYL